MTSLGWYFRPILNSEVTWKNSLILYSVSKPKTVNCCWLSSGCYIHVYKMYKTKWKKPDPLRMCLVLGLLGVRGGNAHWSLSYWWSFSICGAPQRLSSCISIEFSVSKLRSLFLWVIFQYAVFQTSAPLPSFVEMASAAHNVLDCFLYVTVAWAGRQVCRMHGNATWGSRRAEKP